MFPKRCRNPPWRKSEKKRSASWGVAGLYPCSNTKRSYAETFSRTAPIGTLAGSWLRTTST